VLPSLLIIVVALFLAGCGDGGGDTTIIHSTTVPTETAPAATGTTEVPAGEAPVEEFTGRCTSHPAPLVPEPGKPGFTDVRVVEAPCDYAINVATEFVSAYGPECFEGCRKIVESIPCETTGPAEADVVCSAARTEVRFSIQGSD
jgi:hypothetical protein